MTANQEIRGKTFDVQVTAFDEAVVFKSHKADGHVKNAAPQWRVGIWTDFNSRTHEHIVSDEGEIVLCETIHRRQPEDVRCKHMVLDIKRTPLNLKGRRHGRGSHGGYGPWRDSDGRAVGADRQACRLHQECGGRTRSNAWLPRMPRERCGEHRGMPLETRGARVERA